MTGGIVQGGWEFVTAAYTLTAIVFTTYGASLLWRLRAERRRPRDPR
jgi:hypothetical protein